MRSAGVVTRPIILQLADRASGAVLNHVAPLVCELLLCAILLLFTANTAKASRGSQKPLVRWGLKPAHILNKSQTVRFG
jgi:hypothetical protein